MSASDATWRVKVRLSMMCSHRWGLVCLTRETYHGMAVNHNPLETRKELRSGWPSAARFVVFDPVRRRFSCLGALSVLRQRAPQRGLYVYKKSYIVNHKQLHIFIAPQ